MSDYLITEALSINEEQGLWSFGFFLRSVQEVPTGLRPDLESSPGSRVGSEERV